MEDLGAKEQAEVAAANHKPEISIDRQPRQKRQKQVNEQAGPSSSNPKKRGRQPKLSPDEKHKKKNRTYRKNKTAKNEELQKKNQELEEKNEELKKQKEEKQLEINKLNEQLSEIIAQSDKLAREVSDQSEKLETMKMVNQAQEAVMQPLQETILNQGDQEHDAENSDWNIPMDDEYLNKFFLEGMGDFNEFLNSKCSTTKEVPLFGEGCSIAKAISPLHETVNVKGFSVPKGNSDMIQEIFRKFPNAASGIQFHHPASKNGFINTLAEVYKMVTRKEKHSPEEINHMQVGIGDLERAGFEISWPGDLVEKCQEEAEDEEIRIMEDKVKRLKERKSERREEHNSKRQRPI